MGPPPRPADDDTVTPAEEPPDAEDEPPPDSIAANIERRMREPDTPMGIPRALMTPEQKAAAQHPAAGAPKGPPPKSPRWGDEPDDDLEGGDAEAVAGAPAPMGAPPTANADQADTEVQAAAAVAADVAESDGEAPPGAPDSEEA